MGEGDQHRITYAVSNRSYNDNGWKRTKSLRAVDVPEMIIGLQDYYP